MLVEVLAATHLALPGTDPAFLRSAWAEYWPGPHTEH